ncbi:MAG: sigma-70 family RNA polymerase sigma factor [Pyrinomonadaceae bacterium]|nr:sigma-70 family RNA polymerase sigma factor [Pyrinomonadaceae bacterium]
MIISTEDPKRFDVCLVRFQARDSLATEEFQTLVYPYLINLAHKIGRELPEDLRPEIVQQTCLNLLGNSKMKFDPQRGTAKKFLVLAVRNAFRKVRTDYCPPGNPTRPTKQDGAEESGDGIVVPIDEVPESAYSDSCGDGIIAHCEVNSLLKLAPPRVAVALERIYFSGETLIEVAEDLNMSRFKLSRDISAYCSRMQIIAAVKSVIFADQFVC